MNNVSNYSLFRKGALVQGTMIIPFQYAPEKLTRTLTAQTVATGSEQARIKGPPNEKLDLDILIDATDQLERGNGLAERLGIYPSLSALEMLLYPTSARVILNAAMSAFGVIEIIPPLPSLTLLVWGSMRVVPVQVDSFSVTEEQYDTALTPIRANVKLGLKVLTYQDLGLYSAGGMLSLTNHIAKEVMSYMGSKSSVSAMKSMSGK